MSNIVGDLLSNSDQIIAHATWFEIFDNMKEEFKKAGALRHFVSHIWNRKGTFKLGFIWEYKDKNAINQCQKLFRKTEATFVNKTGIA